MNTAIKRKRKKQYIYCDYDDDEIPKKDVFELDFCRPARE